LSYDFLGKINFCNAPESIQKPRQRQSILYSIFQKQKNQQRRNVIQDWIETIIFVLDRIRINRVLIKSKRIEIIKKRQNSCNRIDVEQSIRR